MSLWQRERITAWLSPSRVVLARTRSGLGRESVLSLKERVIANASLSRDPRACLETLEAALVASTTARTGIVFCLSDNFVRYTCLDWRDGLRSPEEWEAYARHELERRYGRAGADCAVRVAVAGAGFKRLAAGIDRSLLASLRQLAAKAKLNVHSVEPNLCRVAHRFRHAVRGAGHLLVAEPDRLTRLGFGQRDVLDVESVRVGGGAHVQALSQMLAQASFTVVPAKAQQQLWLWGALDRHPQAEGMQALPLKVLDVPKGLPEACALRGMI